MMMIDLHCHILPGVGKGPACIAESCDMARGAVAEGIRAIVATPHSTDGFYQYSAAVIADRVKQLNDDFAAAELPVTVFPGAQVHLVPGLARRLTSGRACSINDSRYVLVELPGTILPRQAEWDLGQLLGCGFVPLVAHPERHPFVRNNPDFLAELIESGCLCQVTARSLTGGFGIQVMNFAEKLIQNRIALVIASDAHWMPHPVIHLAEAVAKAARLLGSSVEAQKMVTDVPLAILADEDVALSSGQAPLTKDL